MARTTHTDWFHRFPLLLPKTNWYPLYLLFFGLSLGAQPFPVDTIQWTGPADQRIDMVFLSDGYQQEEFDQFRNDVDKVATHFFKQTPFREYRNYFNLLAIRVPSKQSGAKKDPADELDTYFGSSYNFAGIERLLVPGNLVAALDILVEQVPLFDQAVLIVNDSKYGGSGGWLATTSVHPSAPEIALHEIGHSFAGLADEYWAGEQFAAERPNMSKETDPDLVRWHNWLGDEGIGIYPHQENQMWVRPHQNCKMRVLNPDFCAVCRETLVKRIHDLSYPVIWFDPDNKEPVIVADTQTYRVNFLEPIPNTLKVDWFVGEHRSPAYNSLLIEQSPNQDTVSVQMFVVDSTSYIRDLVHLHNHTFEIPWIQTSEEPTKAEGWNRHIHANVSPNPVDEVVYISIESTNSLSGTLECDLSDIEGNILLQFNLKGERTALPVSHLVPGSYWIRIKDEFGHVTFRFIKI